MKSTFPAARGRRTMATMRSAEERDRQTVAIATSLPLVALAIVACALIIGAASEMQVLPIPFAAYFAFVGARIARRGITR